MQSPLTEMQDMPITKRVVMLLLYISLNCGALNVSACSIPVCPDVGRGTRIAVQLKHRFWFYAQVGVNFLCKGSHLTS